MRDAIPVLVDLQVLICQGRHVFQSYITCNFIIPRLAECFLVRVRSAAPNKTLTWSFQASVSIPNCSHYKYGTSSSTMTGNRIPILSRESCARRSISKPPRDWVRFLRGILPFFCLSTRLNPKRQAIPLQPWTDPEGFRSLRFLEFLDSQHMKVAKL